MSEENPKTDDKYKKFEAGLGGVLAAIAAIQKKEGKKRGVVGTIECPVCGKSLKYSIAASNGHVWGKCETTNCLAWMM